MRLLVDGNAVRGVRTTPSGLDRSGQPTGDYAEPTDLTARVTVIAEGTRGLLSQAYRQWQKIGSPNPQLFALGVKEVWETPKPLDRVVHTLGWPLPTDAFGGSFMYPLGPNQIAIGLVVGLDYHAGRPRCAPAASADEAAPVLPPVPRGRPAAGVGSQDHPGRRISTRCPSGGMGMAF